MTLSERGRALHPVSTLGAAPGAVRAREAASGAATAAAVSIVEHFPNRGERKDDGQQK